MKKKTLQTIVISTSILSSILVVSVIFNWQGNSMQMAPFTEAKKSTHGTSNGETQTLGTAAAASSSSSSSSSNAIQLSVKEEAGDVYRWVSSSDGTINPTLKASPNTANIIKIQNPTDTKHELIIEAGAGRQTSSGDIKPDSSGQLSFKPTMTGTFAYHCAYHPTTMKGTIQVTSGS
jgi:plastocyanin